MKTIQSQSAGKYLILSEMRPARSAITAPIFRKALFLSCHKTSIPASAPLKFYFNQLRCQPNPVQYVAKRSCSVLAIKSTRCTRKLFTESTLRRHGKSLRQWHAVLCGDQSPLAIDFHPYVGQAVTVFIAFALGSASLAISAGHHGHGPVHANLQV